jgi:hypothetical protein
MSDETGFFRQLRIGTELAFLDGLVTSGAVWTEDIGVRHGPGSVLHG